MQFCQPHWDQLRAAIEKRGLSHLGAKSGQEAMDNAVAQLQGEDTPYDPLMTCNNMVMARALQEGGLYLMTGDYCPVCEAEKHGAEKDSWINGPADAVLKHCRDKGLVPKVQ